METMKKEFISVFQITKLITFEVKYYTLSNNKTAHFSTSANLFYRNKRDYERCGQCQEDILPKGSEAMKFFKKWDCKHLQDLTNNEYAEMLNDLENLKNKYNYIIKFLDETKKTYNPHIPFYDIVELSKQSLKTKK